MKITPTEIHGPLAGSNKVDGTNQVYQPGDVMDVLDAIGDRLVIGGKADHVEEITAPALSRPRPQPVKPRKPRKTRGDTKDADSD